MEIRFIRLGTALLTAASFAIPSTLQAAESRRIEEVVVTAERKESSVQDTSISITAFTSEMLDDFGIRNQSDLQNLSPSTTIQPYDAAVRGVGRNFRNLGGDPGIATYMNGVYSEDLYTATIGSFWDIERIEILRGPQGTLYGRNAVGGAMNFLYKQPSSEFEFAVKGIVGDYGTQDAYFMVNAPLVEDVINARLVGSSREHDGWVEEMGPIGDDLDSGDETNIALSIEWIINDNMTFNIRQNKADVDRVMGGAQGGGLVVLNGENIYGDQLRNNTRFSHGLRNVDPTVTDPTNTLFVDQSQSILNFTNPTTGAPIQAQYVRDGVDLGESRQNAFRGSAIDPASCVFTDRDEIDGDDLCAYTNGQNVELFEQQGTQAEFAWDINDELQFKYIFGYNTLFYERITDDDNTYSPTLDQQFYVNHEAEYVSHEFQLFWDVNENLSFTSGVFFYDSTIDQRYDFYSTDTKYSDPTFPLDTFIAAATGGAGIPPIPGVFPDGVPPVPLTFLAGAEAVNFESARDLAAAAGIVEGEFTVATSFYGGEPDFLGDTPSGPIGLGSTVVSTNKTEREAIAIYTQGVWDINEKMTLTFGLRYAEDDITGEELFSQYAESITPLGIVDALVPGGNSLLIANINRGAVGGPLLADGVTPNPNFLGLTGTAEPWLAGTPLVFSGHRQVSRVDDDVTYRVNLDYNLTDDVLVYGNVTTGYRSGGFNLGLFSLTAQYEPEQLTSYELGLKGQYLDSTLQVNASVYFYDYESIHTSTEEACPLNETAQSVQSACDLVDSTTSIQAAPGAEVRGFEAEALWLASDNLTLGGNLSLSDSEYTENFFVVDGADPTVPEAIYTLATQGERARNLKGNQLPQVPEFKFSLFSNYELPLATNGRLNFLANYSYIDEVQFGAFASALDTAPEYDRIDVRGTWTSPSESWVVSGFVNNVTDEIGIREILRHGASDGYRRTAQVTEPRVFGLEVSYTFLN